MFLSMFFFFAIGIPHLARGTVDTYGHFSLSNRTLVIMEILYGAATPIRVMAWLSSAPRQANFQSIVKLSRVNLRRRHAV